LALHREEIACVIPDALQTSNYNFDNHRSVEESRVNWAKNPTLDKASDSDSEQRKYVFLFLSIEQIYSVIEDF
jgi:hypothetical protein